VQAIAKRLQPLGIVGLFVGGEIADACEFRLLLAE